MASKKPGLWETIKRVNATIGGVVDAVVPGGPDPMLRVNDGTCQEKGRLSGNRKCGKPVKRGHETCGHRICATAHQAEHEIVPRADKKPLLVQDPGRLSARRDNLPDGHRKRSGAQQGHGTVMRQQVWDEDRGKWVYPKPGK